jgi:hypothetical protein
MMISMIALAIAASAVSVSCDDPPGTHTGPTDEPGNSDSDKPTETVVSLFGSPPYQEPTPGFVMTRISEGLRQARSGGIPFDGEVEIDSVEQATEHFRSNMSVPAGRVPSYVVETSDWYVFSGWHDTLGNPTTEEIAESHEKLFKRAWAVRKTDGKIFTWNGLTES